MYFINECPNTGKASLVYWKDEDSVSLARLEDMVEQDGDPKCMHVVHKYPSYF